jgi:hypothetical protein
MQAVVWRDGKSGVVIKSWPRIEGSLKVGFKNLVLRILLNSVECLNCVFSRWRQWPPWPGGLLIQGASIADISLEFLSKRNNTCCLLLEGYDMQAEGSVSQAEWRSRKDVNDDGARRAALLYGPQPSACSIQVSVGHICIATIPPPLFPKRLPTNEQLRNCPTSRDTFPCQANFHCPAVAWHCEEKGQQFSLILRGCRCNFSVHTTCTS